MNFSHRYFSHQGTLLGVFGLVPNIKLRGFILGRDLTRISENERIVEGIVGASFHKKKSKNIYNLEIGLGGQLQQIVVL